MDNESTVISELYNTVDELFNNVLGTYTIEEMIENEFTINKLLCISNNWVECLEEVQPYTI